MRLVGATHFQHYTVACILLSALRHWMDWYVCYHMYTCSWLLFQLIALSCPFHLKAKYCYLGSQLMLLCRQRICCTTHLYLSLCLSLYLSFLLFSHYFLSQNGLWFSVGWCVFFFLPAIIFGVIVTTYFRRAPSIIHDFTDDDDMYGLTLVAHNKTITHIFLSPI